MAWSEYGSGDHGTFFSKLHIHLVRQVIAIQSPDVYSSSNSGKWTVKVNCVFLPLRDVRMLVVSVYLYDKSLRFELL